MVKLTKTKKPSADKAYIGVRLPADMYDDFARQCDDADVSLSDAIRQLIAAFLAQVKRSK